MSSSSWTVTAREKHVAKCCEYRFNLLSSDCSVRSSALPMQQMTSCLSNACESVADLSQVLSAGSLESVRFCSTCGRDLSGHYWSDRRRLQHLQSCLGIGRRRRKAKIDPPDENPLKPSTSPISASNTCDKPSDSPAVPEHESTKKPNGPGKRTRTRAPKLTKQMKQQERLLAVERVFGRPLPPDEECESLAFRASELIASQASASTSALELALDVCEDMSSTTSDARARLYCTCDSPRVCFPETHVRLCTLTVSETVSASQQPSLWTLSALADALPICSENPSASFNENNSDTSTISSRNVLCSVGEEFHSQFLRERLLN